MADTDSCGLVKVGDFIHVMQGARIGNTSRTRDTCAIRLCRDKASSIGRGNLVNDGPIEIKVGLYLSRLLLL